MKNLSVALSEQFPGTESRARQYTLAQEICLLAGAAAAVNATFYLFGVWDGMKAVDVTVYQWIVLAILWLEHTETRRVTHSQTHKRKTVPTRIGA